MSASWRTRAGSPSTPTRPPPAGSCPLDGAVLVAVVVVAVGLSFFAANSVATPEGRRGRHGPGRRGHLNRRRPHRRDRRGRRGLQPHAPRPPRAGAGEEVLRQVRHVDGPRRDPHQPHQRRRGARRRSRSCSRDPRLGPVRRDDRPPRRRRDLNEYFTEMVEAIRRRRRTSATRSWRCSARRIASRDHAAMAMRAALDMRGRLRAWNVRREAAGKTALRGIGIRRRHRAGRQHRRRRAPLLRAGGRPGEPRLGIQGLAEDFKVDILISEATRKSPPCPSRSCPPSASRAAPRKSTSTRWCETLSSCRSGQDVVVTLRILGIGNLLGGIVSFFYSRFVDSSAAELPGVGCARDRLLHARLHRVPDQPALGRSPDPAGSAPSIPTGPSR